MLAGRPYNDGRSWWTYAEVSRKTSIGSVRQTGGTIKHRVLFQSIAAHLENSFVSLLRIVRIARDVATVIQEYGMTSPKPMKQPQRVSAWN